MAKKWEGSPKDMALDRKGAKKSGVPMKKWEGSKADEKMDAKGRKGVQRFARGGMAGKRGC